MDHNQLMLKIIDFNIEKERDTYQKIMSNEFQNPYYSLQYLLQHRDESNRLVAFSLMREKECAAIMPMILKPISETQFFDAISPYGYSGPLYQENMDSADIDFFWEKVDEWYKENKIVTEFIRFSLTNNHINYSGNCVKTLTNVCGTLKTDFEKQWESFGRKVRNNYRKAQSFDLTFKLFNSESLDVEVIDGFYNIYYKTMLRNNASKFLFFSAKFFQSMVMAQKESFTIGISYHEGLPVSTELHIHYKDSMYAFLGGTDSDFFHTRPNDFLRVEVIKWAIENKKKRYILGGGIKDNDGLYKSKKAFFPNDEDCIFYTGRKIINKEVYDTLVSKAIKEHSISEDDTYFPLYRKP